MFPTVSIKDIANAAKVSIATASLVLNGKSGAIRISEETRKRVLRIAADMGYVPNLSARKLRQEGESRLTIALLWPVDSRAGLVGDILKGVQEYLNSEDLPIPCDLLVETFRPGKIANVRGLTFPNRFNGAIVANLSHEDEDALATLDVKVPVVLFQRDSQRFGYVDADNHGAGRMMAEHFLCNNHRELSILVPDVSSRAVEKRLDGILSACAGANCGVVIHTCDFSEHGGYSATSRLLTEKRPTGLLCLSDQVAVGALSALNDAGVRVPEDCEVMGFENAEVSQFTIPKLSTVDLPVGAMAAHATRFLVEQILGMQSEVPQDTFSLTVIHRETTKH